MRIRVALSVALLGLLAGVGATRGAGGASPLTGALHQGSITLCTSETGSGGECADGAGLDGVTALAISADGKNVYGASVVSDGVGVFARNPKTGALTQLAGTSGCVSETGSGGECAVGHGLDGARSVAVSPDGTSVYVAAAGSSAVATFARSTTDGRLTFLGCVSDDGSDTCADGGFLTGASSVVVTPDGKNVYVAAPGADAVAEFSRSTKTGQLAPLPGLDACVSDTGSGGLCRDGVALGEPTGLAVGAAGAVIYAAAATPGSIVVFNRVGGALVEQTGDEGCITDTPTAGCKLGIGLAGASHVSASPDGKNAYVTSLGDDALLTFRKTGSNGLQLRGSCFEPVQGPDQCSQYPFIDPMGFAVSKDGTHAFLASHGNSQIWWFDRHGEIGLEPAQVHTARGSCYGCQSNDTQPTGGAADVITSPDGKNIYLADDTDDAIVAFSYNDYWNLLVPLTDCIAETGGEGCNDQYRLKGIDGVTVSSENLAYTTGGGAGQTTTLVRDPVTGTMFATWQGGAEDAVTPGTSWAILSKSGKSHLMTQPSEDAVWALPSIFSTIPPQSVCMNVPPGPDECGGYGLDGPTGAAISPDGKNLYIASVGSNAVATIWFDSNGRMFQVKDLSSCVAEPGGVCADGKALLAARSVAVSPDGKNVYVAAPGSDAVSVFARSKASGRLTQLDGTAGCWSEAGAGGCSTGRALVSASSVMVSKDGKHVVVAAPGSDGVAVFARNPDGSLSQDGGINGCITEDGSSAAGASTCVDGRAFAGAAFVVGSIDGKNVYVASPTGDSIASLTWNTKQGTLEQVPGTDGCISDTGTGGECADGRALDGVGFITFLRDGVTALATSHDADAIVTLRRG